MQYIKFFSDLGIGDIDIVGGKNASLGEMYKNLTSYGIKIPNGFATTSDAYWLMLESNGIKDDIKSILDSLDATDTTSLQSCGEAIRKLILDSTIPKILADEITEAYTKLSDFYSTQDVDVAVRSSGTAEDLPDASFAGQQESFLNVNSKDELLLRVKDCFASIFTDRAISYRSSRGFDHFKVALSIGVQKMVRSDKASSGIMFSIDTESGSDRLILINSLYGLGENIVSGRVNGDEFLVFKPTLKDAKKAILKRSVGSKKQKMLYGEDKSTLNVDTTKEEQNSLSITDSEVEELAKMAMSIEEHYKRAMDIEWAKDGIDISHKIAGASGNLRINQMYEACKRIEKDAAKEIDRDYIDDFNIITKNFEKLKSEVE
jgi:pyruvate,water dikinase